MSDRIFITGYGVITSIGKNKEENFQSLIQRRCGFGTLDFLDTIHKNDLPACEIKLSDKQLCEFAGVEPGLGHTRTALLAIIAVREAIASAALTDSQKKKGRFIISHNYGWNT